MRLVESLKDIEANAFALAETIQSRGKDQVIAASLIRNGAAFFPFFHKGRLAFAPSRFVGYRDNSLAQHLQRLSVSDGRLTNRRIDKILGCKYVEDEALHEELQTYARRIRVVLVNKKHRFWPVESATRYASSMNLAIDDLDDGGPGNDDPEYQKAMRGSYRRDPAVRAAVLVRAAGLCEFCGAAPFVKADGIAYLETHHVISLAQQGPDRRSNVIALCANHHREAHFGREWKSLQTKFLKVLARKGAK